MFKLRFLLLFIFLIPFAGTGVAAAGQEPAKGRVVVLGMDGVDARLAAQWMEAGELPNFKRVADAGTFGALMPGNPAQSPVSWASINTGRNPGKHAIFDFVRVEQSQSGPRPSVGFQSERDVPLAEAGLTLAAPWVPLAALGGGVLLGLLCFLGLRRRSKGLGVLAALVCVGTGAWFWNSLQGAFPDEFRRFGWESSAKAQPFWTELDQQGVRFRGQGVIVDYPAPELEHGLVLCGLGAPDAKGGLNSWAIYTTAESRRYVDRGIRVGAAVAEADAADPKERHGASAGSGRIYKLESKGDGRFEAKIFGPANQVVKAHYEARLEDIAAARRSNPTAHLDEEQRLKALVAGSVGSLLDTWVPLEARWQPGAASLDLTVDGTKQSFAVGSWSDFYPLEFVWSPWLSTHALVRVWAEEIDGALELYSSPLQIDPRKPIPGSRICWPPAWAADLAADIGLFETLGWACQTHPMKDARLSEAAFLADIEFTYGWRRKLLDNALASDDWDVLFHFFGSPDRVCHMLMWHFDVTHPQHDPALAAREIEYFGETIAMRDVVLATYRKMDEAVGVVLDALGPDDKLMIVSDHGFDSFRREVSLNNWLVDEGFLGLKTTDRFGLPTVPSSALLGYVDWNDTQAYSIAIGKIYVAKKGREAQGTVEPEQVDAVIAQLTARLMEMTDPDTGEKMVRRVYRRDELYSGDWWQERRSSDPAMRADGAAELTIDLAPGYRAAWVTTSGGIRLEQDEDADGNVVVRNGPFVYDNTSPWCGDHCGVDLAEVQGIFFSNVPMRATEAVPDVLPGGFDARQIAPTVLDLMGVPVPADYDLKPLTAGAD
ncbi:MAG TPA: alkaline phosphatase family protein [Planctomycetota bacterium]